ncbi:helix-turn-helix transcriptional regulator [Yinghuangia soli]|uniref:AraC family transcriptional regulator n=1 Tax=Yinghuangia soli TaxID=2908204 RepID=A0AA41U3N9_9ACTN|nr:AraC family transcriptional regulator [Yinghuangia soli]MCF2532020.1 AraC family transcriptional regulator [Yinghuangia soli]
MAGPAVPRADISAWRPDVPGISEVFHAHFTEHVYPKHTHDTWTLLIVDDGAVRYGLDRHEHGALPSTVSVLPPQVPHDGRTVHPEGFRKRVLYLDAPMLDGRLIGRAVDDPTLADPLLGERIGQLHAVLEVPDHPLEAASRLALIRERLVHHLDRPEAAEPVRRDARLAHQLRELLDARMPQGVTLEEASALLHAHPAHLVRSFTREHGLPPHRYLTGRRVELARGLLLDGRRPAEVAGLAGFFDQSHLNRHFRKMLGISPAAYAGRGKPARGGRRG